MDHQKAREAEEHARRGRILDRGDGPLPKTLKRVGSNATQATVIGGWKPSGHVPHQGAREIARRKARLEKRKEQNQ